MEFLQKIVRLDTVQYLLILLDEVLSMVVHHSSELEKFEKQSGASVYAVLMRLLLKEDEFTALKSAKLVAELFRFVPDLPLTCP